MATPKLAETVKGKGRHYRHPVTEELHVSVTNLIGVLDKPALPRWAAKLVAETAYQMRHSLTEMDQVEAIDILKAAPWRKTTRAANRGGDVHKFLENVARGSTPQPLTGEAAAYQAGVETFLAQHELEAWHTEVTVFSRHGYAGTADFLGTIDGVPVVIDYKTGKGLYSEVGLQIAALRHADEMVTDDGLVPMPETEAGVAILIQPDGFQVRQVDSGPEVFEAFLSLIRLWEFRQRKDVVFKTPFNADAPGREGPGASDGAEVSTSGD